MSEAHELSGFVAYELFALDRFQGTSSMNRTDLRQYRTAQSGLDGHVKKHACEYEDVTRSDTG